MTNNIVISHPKKIEEFKKSISEAGCEKLHILSDFDRTLTMAFVDGKSRPSVVSVLRDGNYLSPDYAEKAYALYAKYHPIEIDPKISLREKKRAMHEWWTIHFDLRIKSGLNKKHLEKIVESGKIKFRQGISGFINFLHIRNIPLVIMSSSSIGGDFIRMYLAKEGKLYDNIHIISNLHKWDESGNAIGYKKPVIHIMNKDETAIQNFPIFNIIKDKRNVMLLGDSLGDIGMVTGFNYDNLIRIGFLNENIEENLEQYKRNFDILILNDSSMYYVNKLLKEIC
jgi:cytosolic 5'-nucleotidase 3